MLIGLCLLSRILHKIWCFYLNKDLYLKDNIRYGNIYIWKNDAFFTKDGKRTCFLVQIIFIISGYFHQRNWFKNMLKSPLLISYLSFYSNLYDPEYSTYRWWFSPNLSRNIYLSLSFPSFYWKRWRQLFFLFFLFFLDKMGKELLGERNINWGEIVQGKSKVLILKIKCNSAGWIKTCLWERYTFR